MRRLRDGVAGEAGRQNRLNLYSDLQRPADILVRAAIDVLHDRADELEAQHEQNEKYAHNLARTALRQPALEPGKDHLHEYKVEKAEGDQHEQRPRKQRDAGEAYTEKHSHEPDAANGARGIAKPISQPHQKIRAVGQREAQQFRRIGIVRESRRHHGEELPEKENGPEQDGEELGFPVRDEIPREARSGDEAAEAAEGKERRNQQTRSQFGFATAAA